jgi:hypothetical protein
MSDITGGSLINEGRELRDRLVAENGDELVIRKLNDLLSLPFLHGGMQAKLRGIIEKERAKSK